MTEVNIPIYRADTSSVVESLLTPEQIVFSGTKANELIILAERLDPKLQELIKSTMYDALSEIEQNAALIQALSDAEKNLLATFVEGLPGHVHDIVHQYISDFPALAPLGTLHIDAHEAATSIPPNFSTIHRCIVDAESVGNHELLNHFPVLRQIYRDAVTVAQIGDQRTNSMYQHYEKAKVAFYKAYENMGAASATTSSVDILRTFSLLAHDTTRPHHSIVFGGCGNMRRFESPLIDTLQSKGVKFAHVIGVDRVDQPDRVVTSANGIPITFIQDELTNAIRGKKHSAIVCPWSMTCDVLTHLDRISLLRSLADGLEENGMLIIDNACPVGEQSYQKALNEQAVDAGQLGVFVRSFDGPDGQKLWSTFHIIELEKLCRDAAQVGLIPINVPPVEADQTKLIQTVFGNEQQLAQNAISGADTDATQYPFYQANGNNRYTIAFRKATPAESRKVCRLPQSLLHSLLAMQVYQS